MKKIEKSGESKGKESETFGEAAESVVGRLSRETWVACPLRVGSRPRRVKVGKRRDRCAVFVPGYVGEG